MQRIVKIVGKHKLGVFVLLEDGSVAKAYQSIGKDDIGLIVQDYPDGKHGDIIKVKRVTNGS